ncbi:hypothetical protein [uncultured Gammaproteobacteria bacterium]|nr:hypothetical protein [uncultured Gammaproteobacteria bacterium]
MDFATTMDALSWEFYNRFFNVLVDYGIVYLPLLMFLYKNWLSEDILGTDANQTIVAMSVKRMLVSVTLFFFLFYLAFSPIVPLSMVNNQKAQNPIPTYDSDFNRNLKKAGDKFLAHDIEIKLPFLWAGMEIFTHTVTTAFLNSLPKTAGDIRGEMATVIKHSDIKESDTARQYNNFYNRCYSQAKGKLSIIKKEEKWWTGRVAGANWVGSGFFLHTEGFYKPCLPGNACYKKAPSTPDGFYYSEGLSCQSAWGDNNSVAFLPLGQAIALAFFVILLPVAMIVSALRVEVFISFLVYYFTISFLTVIWAIVAFIDNNIMNILSGNTGTGVGSGVAETASQIVTHTTLTGSLISIATTFLYYQATKKWLNLMAMAGAQGAEEASSAMEEMGNTGKEVGDTMNSAKKKLTK